MNNPLAFPRNAPDDLAAHTSRLAEWCAKNPKQAAEEIERLRALLGRAETRAAEESWRTNPDRMGS